MEKDKQTVLVVDDEQPILNSVRRLLKTAGFEVLCASDPVNAIDILKSNDVNVLITDYMMPGLDGIDLLVLVRENWPDLASIMMTASPDVRVAAEAVNRNLIDFFVTKPWDSKNLVELVRRAAAKNQPAATGSGQLFGKYRLRRLLAQGGMAELWLATIKGAEGFEKKVVVKKVLEHLSRDPNFVEMFIDEARMMSKLNHGNIVSVIDFGQEEGSYFMVMEHVDGPDLRQLLYGPDGNENSGNEAALPVATACFIARQVALGLDYAHRKTDDSGKPLGLVHRDIAPQNILVSREGVVKIADFGIAKAEGIKRRTTPGMVRGTLYYMSHEQITARPVDHRTDIYALSAVLYEMLAGRPPFLGATHQETVAQIVNGSYPPLRKLRREVPRQVVAVVEKGLRRNPRFRHQSAAEFEHELGVAMLKSRLSATQADVSSLVEKRMPREDEEQW
ncbi:MAG: response regulator [Deltaproteobacteria bacterium]|nr:MAG: response regulator [Deltaproteobacteria bacterium]